MYWAWIGIVVAAAVILIAAILGLRQLSERAAYRTARRPFGGRQAPVPIAPARVSSPAPAPGRPIPDTEDDPYRELMNLVGGDRAKAERLITYEQRKQPGAIRTQLIKNAIELIRYDQRS